MASLSAVGRPDWRPATAARRGRFVQNAAASAFSSGGWRTAHPASRRRRSSSRPGRDGQERDSGQRSCLRWAQSDGRAVLNIGFPGQATIAVLDAARDAPENPW